jgi:PAS domain S-box-containing protein
MLNKFKSLSIRLKLLCGFGVVGGMLLLLGGFAVFGMNRLNASTESIYKVNLLPVTVLSDLRAAMLKRSNFVVWHILAHDGPTMAAREKAIKDLDSEIEELLAKYAPIIITESEQKTFDRFKAGVPPYLEIRGKVLQLSKNFSKDAAAEAQKTELAETLGVLYGALDALIEENKKQAQDSYTSSHELGLFFNWTMGLVSICALVLGAFVLWYVSKLIGESLRNVLEAAHQFQAGNLAYRATVRTQDETGQLAQAFNQMGEQIEANVKGSVESKYMMAAVGRAQAIIEFKMDGTILTANDNFLKTLGYTLDEIKGQHHRMFADPGYASSPEYAAFWAKLNRGEYDANVYRRLGKGGKEIWIQASYNPILDANGKVYKVVKFATDITPQKQAQAEVEKLISMAAVGQLSERIKTDVFFGAPKELTESFNRLLDAITTPLHDAQMALTALASNDLTRMMTGSYQGEFEQMKISMNSALKNLAETISAVRETTESVTTNAEHITAGNENLSQRTSEQASSIEETSASMEEMTSTVKQNADNAKQANQLAISAREIADRGGAVTIRAVEAMDEINKSSKKIADIITVIDEIAFQTNLLALNAAVEAARAGEHGRGFAVVAAEVRNLAQRSATAAKEIKGLINESIQRVNDGSALVNQSGKTLEDIVNSVKRVTDIIAEITAASQEQAVGIDQVNKAVMVVDETTQQNAALVEETTSASQSMKSQVAELFRRMSMFKLQELSEEEKAKSPAVSSVREHAARSIDRAYNMRERKPDKPRPPKTSAPKQASAVSVAAASGGTEGFEEF